MTEACFYFTLSARSNFAGDDAIFQLVHGTRLVSVFCDACFTHFNGWRHGFLLYEATGLSHNIQRNFSVFASIWQHGGLIYFVGSCDYPFSDTEGFSYIIHGHTSKLRSASAIRITD